MKLIQNLGIRRCVTAAAAVAMVTAAAACSSGSSGSGSATAAASLLTEQSSSQQAQLLTEAKQEGSLSWVTSLAGPVVDAVIHAFNQQYPSIKVTVTRGDEDTIIPQAIQELQAGKSAPDVFEVTSTGALEFTSAGVLTPFYDPASAQIPAQYQVKSGSDDTLVTDRVSYISLGYNTKKVSAGAAPKTLSDLLSPSLSGDLALETDTTSEEWIGGVLHLMGQSKGTQFLKQLGAQHVAQTSVSGAALMGLVASGQYGICTCFHNHEQQDAAQGSPVAWTPVEPVIANVGELGILKGSPHPAAALLFVDFITGTAGQKVLTSEDYTPPEDKQPFTSWIPTSGATSATAYNQTLQSWTALQKQDFGG
jgi:ABC-type Fe3+ transport system substrate-binding protein